MEQENKQITNENEIEHKNFDNKQKIDNNSNEIDGSVMSLIEDVENPDVSEDDEKKPLDPHQMMNRFVPFKEMPVGTVFELSGLRMKKMEYARRPDIEDGFFNAIQLGIENGYMWVKEDNSFKVVPTNIRKNNNRNRRKKYSRGNNRSRNNSENNQNSRNAPNK